MSVFLDIETSPYSAAPAELYKFTIGNLSYFYTSADVNQRINGLTYFSVPISRTELSQTNEDSACSVTVTVPANTAIAARYIKASPSQTVYIEIYRQHLNSDEYAVIFSGALSSASFDDQACSLTATSTANALLKVVPARIYQVQCSHTLFQQNVITETAQAHNCGVNKSLYKIDCVISSTDTLDISSDQIALKPDGWFTEGFIETINGEIRWITNHEGNTITLSQTLDVSAGDTIYAYPGCNRFSTTCRDKFNNLLNFNGFTRMPTKNPFNSSIS